MKSSFTQRYWFWIFLVSLFCGSILFVKSFYPKAFPLVELNIAMDRTRALSQAKELALKNHWGPDHFLQSAEFSLDRETQTYAELTGEGYKTFSNLLKDKFYSPYTWRVRHFKEGSAHETYIQFTPEGKLYSFTEIIPEGEKGAALSQEEALKIAKYSAEKLWNIPLEEYKLAEKSFIKRPNQRIDHFFTFENSSLTLGKEGKYRINLTVRGDRLCAIQSYIKIPESFSRQYAEMRSANQTITSIASVAMLILYILGGCFIGTFLLARKNWVLWKKPLLFGFLVSLLQFLDQINHFPLLWMQYDTAISSQQFMSNILLRSILSSGADFILISLSFMAAESLSRKAFSHHPQLWRVWNFKNASSPEVLGRTLGGYLGVGVLFSYVIAVYLIGTNKLGWWTPSDTLFQPDALASYFPWLTSISSSLHAGFWEESLFRAVPIAGAALLGSRFGNKKLWISGGFILQALIFAAAHANYPTQPSYARVIELILPSFFFGLLYLRFGLLPGIILHFTFDVVFFAIPLFATSSPQVKWDQFLVIFLTLTPFWIVLLARIRQGAWRNLDVSQFNLGWKPEPTNLENTNQDHSSRGTQSLTPWTTKLVLFFGAISLTIWAWIQFPYYSWNLNISRQQALQIAKEIAHSQGFSDEWEAHPLVLNGMTEGHRFIWKTQTPEVYSRLLGSYLSPPVWGVRFMRHDREVSERAEELLVTITKNGKVHEIRHQLPESRPGMKLLENEAKAIALHSIQKIYGLSESQIKSISSSDSKLPERKDWNFIFQDPSIQLSQGEARILAVVSGNEMTHLSRYIFIPEEWMRTERNKSNHLGDLHLISIVALAFIAFIAFVHGITRWTKRCFHFDAFWRTSLIIFALQAISIFNLIPNQIAQLSTVEPKMNQILTLFLFTTLKVIFSSMALGVMMGFIYSYFKRENTRSSVQSSFKTLITGYSLSAISLVILTGIFRLFQAGEPTLPFLDPLAWHIPLLASTDILERVIQVSLLFLVIDRYVVLITSGWQRRKGLIYIGLVALGVLIIGVDAIDLKTWLALGIPLGCILSLLYRIFFWQRMSLIPAMVAGLYTLNELRHIRFHAFPGSNLYSVVTIVLISLGALLWIRDLNERN